MLNNKGISNHIIKIKIDLILIIVVNRHIIIIITLLVKWNLNAMI
jgi:hypothetical protein